MKFDVSQDAMDRTTQCPRNFACLEAGACLCEVLFGGETELILNTFYSNACPYSKPFDLGYFCTCPVHCELNNRYRYRDSDPE